MDFQQQLLRVCNALTGAEVQNLIFLCKDLIDRDLSGITEPSDLFLQLQNADLLTAENPLLLSELLYLIKRQALARQLALPEPPSQQIISDYRRLLFELSENVTTQELKRVKFLLQDNLDRSKLEENKTLLSVFVELEKRDLLGSNNLDILKNTVGFVCPKLKKKIALFTNKNGFPVMDEHPVSYSTGDQACSSSIHQRPASWGSASQKKEAEQYLQDRRKSYEAGMSLEHYSVSASQDAGLEAAAQSLSLGNTASFNNQYTSNGEKQDKVCPTRDASEVQDLKVYKMSGKKRGFCLIINNCNFSPSSKLKKREGTHEDEKSLNDVFTWLGFQTRVEHDCSRNKILSLISKLGSCDHIDMDCLVCCVLSHGLKGIVYGVDGQKVALTELTEPFSGSRCASLRGKPKLFFIQACQGTEEQKPVSLQSDGPSSQESDALADITIPDDADILLGMSTLSDYASFRDKRQGTWYIQSLCKNLLTFVPRGVDLLSILTEVNNDVSLKTDLTGIRKQMPQPVSCLRKRVIFPPPSVHKPLL